MLTRNMTKQVNVGNLKIGGQNKVIIQSMCNTKTKDVESTVKQILELEELGCQIIRVAILDEEDARAIKQIKEKFTFHLLLISILIIDLPYFALKVELIK